jgi:enoyl-CoA hydratase
MAEAATDGEAVLQVERDEGFAVVTLDRPAARNALNARLRAELHETMRTLDDDPEVAAVVLTGADPAFCAGLDLKELAATPEALSGGFDDAASLRRPYPQMSTPVIGAINGVAITGGFELALACDFLVASEHARFADTHARVGVMPGWGLTVLLAEAVGVRRARELSTTGNYIDAEVAAGWGLVNHVIAHAELLPFCRRLAADIVSNDQAGVRQMLDTYQQVISTTGDEGWRIEAEVSRAWAAEHLDPAAVEARRLAIVERGRSQQT